MPYNENAEIPHESTHPSPHSTLDPRSLTIGLSCYFIWGFFPIYFHALAPAGALEVIVHRAVWGLASAFIVVIAVKRWGKFRALLRDRQAVVRLLIAGWLIVINWSVYVFAVQSGHTVDAAVGYFINPLVTVALARFALHEVLTRAQAIAVGLGMLAVAVLIIGMGRLPWISLALAFSFGLYALVKKKVASRVPPLEGMAVETAAVVPFLLGYFVFLLLTNNTSFHRLSESGASDSQLVWHGVLLVGSGILTLIPLLMFARAAQGLPLGILGLIQYIAPIMQLIIGIFVFHEQMSVARWMGTIIIWCALVVLSIDWIRQIRALTSVRKRVKRNR